MAGPTKLRLEQFRSFEHAELILKTKTAVVGPNGAGKSNLIEAIRLLSVGKSFKTSRLDEAVRFGAPFFRLQLTRPEEPREIEFFYGQQFESSPQKDRQLRVENQETTWNEFWGQFPSVLFVPTDLEIVIGAPQIRRRYLDGLLWQTSAEFRQSHLELSRVLRERSALLFLLKTNRAGQGELAPWNELLTNLTEKVRHYRQLYVDFLGQSLKEYGSVFTHGAVIDLDYMVNTVTPDEVYKEEVRLSQNLVGPHRDELEILFNDQSARKFCSRGQARAIVVMLKVAEAAFLGKETGREPLILLDDMFSELDQPTAQELFGRFGNQYPLVATSIEPNPLIQDWHQLSLP